MKDPTSLGRYLGDEYFSFAACDDYLDDILLLETHSGARDIWSKEELRKVYRLSSCTMVVVYLKESAVTPIAYLAYSVSNKQVHLWSMTVAPSHRKRGLGRKMLRWVGRENGTMDLHATVRETDLPCQIFFRQCGFTCMKILKGSFKAPPDDGYYFSIRSLR